MGKRMTTNSQGGEDPHRDQHSEREQGGMEEQGCLVEAKAEANLEVFKGGKPKSKDVPNFVKIKAELVCLAKASPMVSKGGEVE
ncbi:unnamed protein product [Citrullus colocynthis]|uniref:Uncharacterized protein n=1 Tax=Citrullus colocynthis TaxID=252529 RepID=A0ABP0Z5Q1_9ROSI